MQYLVSSLSRSGDKVANLLHECNPAGRHDNKWDLQEETSDKMRNQKGFSLIELLIVVAIILIIAAIAIPNLMRARIAANESAGASTVRTLNTAEVTYSTTYASFGYAPDRKSTRLNSSH